MRAGDVRMWARRLVLLVVFGALLLSVALVWPSPVWGQDAPDGHLEDLINQARVDAGLPPLGHSTLLAQAAQRHADDLVGVGQVTHTGSDGSTYQQRIREARYQAWNDGLMVDEVIWAGLGNAEDAVIWFYTHPERSVLTDPRYREIGVGYADGNGVRYFVVALGARPGVLPVFVNDEADVTESPAVALRLTNEEAVPLGEGTWIGRAIEIRISNEPDFEGQPWQPWEPLVPWMLASEDPDDYAVYVEFRDGAERTAIAEATIRLVRPGESPPTPTPFLGLPLAPAEPTPDPVLTPDPGSTPSDSPGGLGPAPSTPVGDAQSLPTPFAVEGTLTPYPTWTPLPTDVSTETQPSGTDWSLPLVILLQGGALLLGFAAFLRRH